MDEQNSSYHTDTDLSHGLTATRSKLIVMLPFDQGFKTIVSLSLVALTVNCSLYDGIDLSWTISLANTLGISKYCTKSLTYSFWQVIVLGGGFEPEMSIRVGTKDVLGRFKKSTQRSWPDADGVIQRGYRLTLTYMTYHPPINDNGKSLFCRATVPTFPSRNAKAIVNVTCEYIFSVRWPVNSPPKCFQLMTSSCVNYHGHYCDVTWAPWC